MRLKKILDSTFVIKRNKNRKLFDKKILKNSAQIGSVWKRKKEMLKVHDNLSVNLSIRSMLIFAIDTDTEVK